MTFQSSVCICALRGTIPSKSITGVGSALGGEDVSGTGGTSGAVAGGAAGGAGDVNESKQSDRQRQKQEGIELL